jgi:hypothetical protein
MIDYLLAFTNEVAAQSDPVVGAYWVAFPKGGGCWNSTFCVPDIFVWSPSQDTTVNQQVVHTPFDANWRVLIVSLQPNSSLLNHSACELAWDVDAQQLLKLNMTPQQLDALMLQPVISGRNYPFGNAP